MIARKARFAESSAVLSWLIAYKDRNKLDMDVLDYPTSEVYIAESDRPLAAMPIHAAIILESIGYRPDAKPREMVEAVDALIDNAVVRAKATGIRELMFISSDPEVDKAAERRGFERVTCYRRKIT